MSNQTSKYLPLKELLSNKAFRIPDYQRGYAWGARQLEDLWSDLTNLQKGNLNFHYTGMITVEEIPKEEWSSWEDSYYFKGVVTPYSVVDGQQRLTSIIILLFELLASFPKNTKIDGMGKSYYQKHYILRDETPDAPVKSFVFGYDSDNPSDIHFKTKVLEFSIKKEYDKTAYTNNLTYAKDFFKKKITAYQASFSIKKRKQLIKLLLEQFMFDFKVLARDLDIFMVFETVNNRGKPLSKVEKLKNRLIYLATLLYHMENPKPGNKQDNKLRQTIVYKWKEIYHFLGKSEGLLGSDNTLLKNHWIMYENYDRRRSEFYDEDIFKKQFTVGAIVDKNTNKDSIENYVSSLEATAQWWFIINNPYHKDALTRVNNLQITKSLAYIKRLGMRFYAPLIFAGMQCEGSKKERIAFLKAIERYIFLIFLVSYRRSNTGSYHFQAYANKLYKGQFSLNDAIASLDNWIYGGDGYYGYFDYEQFKQYLEPRFENYNQNGFKDWAGAKYFFAEYYNRNIKNTVSKDKYQLVPIFTNKKKKIQGFNKLASFKKKQRHLLQGSLGNLLYLKEVPVDFHKKTFDQVKKFLRESNQCTDILNYEQWTPKTIQKRGHKLISFLDKRWKVPKKLHLSTIEKDQLLYIDFLTPLMPH